jgi:hypothetical protein
MDEEKKKLIQAIYKILHGTRIGPGMPALYPEELEAQSLIGPYTTIGTPGHDLVFDEEWYRKQDEETRKWVEERQKQDLAFLYSEITELNKMLDKCPDGHVIDRMSLEARKEKVQKEIDFITGNKAG